MSYIDVTGKTEEEAIQSALAQLGMERDDVSVEILERAKHETMPQEVIDASIQLAIQEGRISEDEAEKLYLMLSL